MKKPFLYKENGIEWYVNLNPVDKYLKIDRIDNQIASKFVHVNYKKRFTPNTIKNTPKHRLGSSSI